MKVLAVAIAVALGALADPLPQPLPASRLIQTSHIDGPLEVRPANQDEEAVMAGGAYVQQRYDLAITPAQFVTLYRENLFAAGWKLIASTKVDNVPPPDGVVSVAAHYMNDGRNIYTLISREPDGPYQIAVADVGAEDWGAALAKECRVTIRSLHFDLDRPALREYESLPTLEKLADLLKAKSTPPVEIQGHMDNIGESGVAARQTLSEARARTVAAWLTSHGVPAAKITSKGYGKTRPIAENDSDLGRELNRRIDVACLRH
jgi:outer membrane protein OmpA-like peptidoglycan-associated protein